jgi:hypothetical protein
MYKQISQIDDIKTYFKEIDGVVSTGFILLRTGKTGGHGPLMVFWL